MSALGAVMAEPTLLGKVMAGSILGIPAAALLSARTSEKLPGGTTSEGVEIPMSTMIGSWKHKKTASHQPRLGTVAGMAMPGALALDYLYNRWKYGPYADPQENMGDAGKAMHRAGSFVTDHPLATTLAGGLLGSQAGRGARGLRNMFTRKR